MKYPCFIFLFFYFNLSYGQVKTEIPQIYLDSGIVLWDYHSQTIGEDYTLFVNTPADYDTSKAGYPVLYLTDGDWNVIPAMGCFSMLDQDYETVYPIIVGIGYNQRTNQRARDLNPATGGPHFLEFIEKEVMPFINSKYRVNDHKALYGYSYGGLFTTSVLFEHPGLFNTIFIGAPGNSGRDLVPSAKKYFASHTDLPCRVFAGVGSFEAETVANIKKFKDYLLKQHCKSLDLKTVIVPEAGHGAALGPVMENAIKFAYCKMHTPVRMASNELQKYAGHYHTAEAANMKFSVFVADGKLYFQQGEQIPVRFVPYAKNCFFMYENEKTDIRYMEDQGKKYMLFTNLNGEHHRLDKID